MCGCYHCKNRTNDICGRFPDFLNEEQCKTAGIEWDEELYVDCFHCNEDCPTIICVYFEEDNDEKE